MKKLAALFPLVIAIGLAFFAYFQFLKPQPKPEPEATASPVKSEPMPIEEVLGEYSESARKFKIAEGSTVSYKALKNFFNKPEEQVTGTSDQISGEGWYYEPAKSAYVMVKLNIDSVKTDNSKRDNDVQKLFTDHNVVFESYLPFTTITPGQDFETDALGNLTLNGVTKVVTFKVKGLINSSGLTAKGTTTIKMSDFGISPPSLVNVSTVDDNLDLNFDIKAR